MIIVLCVLVGLIILVAVGATIKLFINEDGPQDDGWGEFKK